MTVDRDEDNGNGIPMVKCPACDTWLKEDDFDGQRVHLLANHPWVVRSRLKEHERYSGWERED